MTRACQSVGFSGYPHLRRHLARDSGVYAVRVDSAPAHPVQRLYAEAARDLEAAAATVDLEEFERCADVLATARRLLIIGSGSSAPTVWSATIRFLSLGITVEALTDPTLQVMSCQLLSEKDAVIAISDSGENTSTLSGAQAARNAGAQIIAVSSFPRSKLSKASDHALIAGSMGRPWPESVTTSTTLQALLLNALVATIAERRGAVEGSTEVTEAVLRAVTDNRRPGA